MKKNYLMTPGPTPVPPDVLLEMAKPLMHHRTPRYQQILKKTNEALRAIFKTEHEVMTFASSGTGAMEASVVNLLSPEDNVIVVKGGKFGERFGEILDAHAVRNIAIHVPWGQAVAPEEVAQTLRKHKGIKAVFATLCETSTGTVTDIKAVGEVVRKTGAVLVVDAISGLGADDLATDSWGADVVVGGSQKGLMIPPGLGFISLSDKAWKLVERATLPKYYFDVKKYKKSVVKNDTPFTSAITLMIGLNKALEMMTKEGIENILTRHQKLAEATREAMRALGLKLFSSAPSNAVTAVSVPGGIDGAAFVKSMRDECGVTIAGGQGVLKGKIFRIAHLGFMERLDVILAVAAVEIALKKMGFELKAGTGVRAAEAVLA